MSWLEKLLPPKIQQTDPADRRSVPEGLWVKCPSCETVLYKTDLEQNQNVCPTCSHHHRMGARAPQRFSGCRGPLRAGPGSAAGGCAQIQGQPALSRAAQGSAGEHW